MRRLEEQILTEKYRRIEGKLTFSVRLAELSVAPGEAAEGAFTIFASQEEIPAQGYVLTKDEGGRHTPSFTNYRPQFYFRTTDVTGVVNLPDGVEMCMPGDNITMSVELTTTIAIEEGLRFAIREGGRTVGSGVVTEIIK